MSVFSLASPTEKNNRNKRLQLKVSVMSVLCSPPHLSQVFFKGLSLRGVLCMINSLRSGYPGNKPGDGDFHVQVLWGALFRRMPTRE